MEIRTPIQLRSLVSEASRQADHYRHRGNTELHAMWDELASLAFVAQGKGGTVLISEGDLSKTPIPIKAGEQVEKPRNNLPPRHFR